MPVLDVVVLLVVRVPVVELPRVLVPWVLLPDVELLVVVVSAESVIFLSPLSRKEMVVKRPLREVVFESVSRSFILPGVVGLVPVGVFEGVASESFVSKIDGRRDGESPLAALCVVLVCSGPLTRTK